MEFREGKYLFSLDGRVLEGFHSGSDILFRMHVEFVGVKVTPKRDGQLKVLFGRADGDDVRPGMAVEIAPDRQPELEAFVGAMKAARDAGPS